MTNIIGCHVTTHLCNHCVNLWQSTVEGNQGTKDLTPAALKRKTAAKFSISKTLQKTLG